jgi:hypothetical protein
MLNCELLSQSKKLTIYLQVTLEFKLNFDDAWGFVRELGQ